MLQLTDKELDALVQRGTIEAVGAVDEIKYLRAQVENMKEFKVRLQKAESELLELWRKSAMDSMTSENTIRLRGKYEGIRLALSYLKEVA